MIRTTMLAACLLFALVPAAHASETCAPPEAGDVCVRTSSYSIGEGSCESSAFYAEGSDVGVDASEPNTQTLVFAHAGSYCYHSDSFGSGAGDSGWLIAYTPDGSIHYVYLFWTQTDGSCTMSVLANVAGVEVPRQELPCAGEPVQVPALP